MVLEINWKWVIMQGVKKIDFQIFSAFFLQFLKVPGDKRVQLSQISFKSCLNNIGSELCVFFFQSKCNGNIKKKVSILVFFTFFLLLVTIAFFLKDKYNSESTLFYQLLNLFERWHLFFFLDLKNGQKWSSFKTFTFFQSWGEAQSVWKSTF